MSGRAAPGESACAHCGLPAPAGGRFCCPGCAAASDTIAALGLDSYYTQRLLDPQSRPLRPEPAEALDLTRFITTDASGQRSLLLAVEGLQCGACVWLIEQVLARTALRQGRVNMTTRRLRLVWNGPDRIAADAIAAVAALGYRLVPFDTARLAAARDETGRTLLRALAVAGFAAGNTMLISLALWIGAGQNMGPGTRDLLHWVSAAIALPAVVYAGRPFFVSAFQALRRGRTNMDVPISLGVALVSAMSLAETLARGPNTYFDSAITLVFFLLIGRVVDHRARAQARATAEQLLALQAATVTVLAPDGLSRGVPAASVQPGWRVLVSRGERIGVDGVITQGSGLLDTSLITGESLPAPAAPGCVVHAGTVNLGDPLTLRATGAGEATVLAECVRLIEAAEARRSRAVVLADRVARLYVPVVHVAAALTFAGWMLIAHAGLEPSLLAACAVLIVTCPCALALAIPAVQMIATSRLLRQGVLLKSATALERLAAVDTVVFDKTGTLTRPTPALLDRDAVAPDDLRLAASLAASSRHPLSRALLQAAGPVPIAAGVVEVPGQGLLLATAEGEVRLGSRTFVGADATHPPGGPALYLARPGRQPVCLRFGEQLRPEAAAVLRALERMRLEVMILSGDQPAQVAAIADTLGVANRQGGCTPVAKLERIEALRAAGRHVLMVGDGLNDGPSLSAADVSMSPSTAADLSQTLADVVFQGDSLAPVLRVLALARLTRRLMRQNLALALGYNAVMVPLAMAGLITPWLAAAAMSASSLLVLANAFRAGRRTAGGQG
jgi:Cu2+-exporting ATPase